MAYKMSPPNIIAERFVNNSKFREEKFMKPYTLRKYVSLTIKTELHVRRPYAELVSVWVKLVKPEVELIKKKGEQLNLSL